MASLKLMRAWKGRDGRDPEGSAEPDAEREEFWGHPTPEQLGLFMAGRLSRKDACRVVRHLLKSCRKCRAITDRIWRFADAKLLDPDVAAGGSTSEGQRFLEELEEAEESVTRFEDRLESTVCRLREPRRWSAEEVKAEMAEALAVLADALGHFRALGERAKAIREGRG